MELSSVDDRYPTCREEMMGNITTGDLLTRERQASPSFSTAWSQAERCNVTVANLTDLHVTALTLYTNTYNRTFRGSQISGPRRQCLPSVLPVQVPPLPAD